MLKGAWLTSIVKILDILEMSCLSQNHSKLGTCIFFSTTPLNHFFL